MPHVGRGVYEGGPSRAVRLVLASDVRLLCESLQVALEPAPQIEVAAIAGDAEQAVGSARVHSPAVVLLDVSMPGALDATRLISRELPETPTVAVAVDESVATVVECAEAGAAGYVPHDATLEQLRETVLSVAAGETPCSPRVAAGVFRRLAALSAERRGLPPPPERLTPRELEVLELIRHGLSNKEISARLQIALPTVKNHVHRILEKLQVDRRGQAANWLRS